MRLFNPAQEAESILRDQIKLVIVNSRNEKDLINNIEALVLQEIQRAYELRDGLAKLGVPVITTEELLATLTEKK